MSENLENRPWTVMIGSDVYGPYTPDELVKYCREGRVIKTSPVRHHQLTRGNWMSASTVPFLSPYFPPEVVAPPVSSASTEPEFNPFAVPKRMVHRKQSRIENLGPAEILAAFFDPSFKHRLTPLIVKFTWVSVVFILVLMVVNRVLYEVAAILPDSASSTRSIETLADSLNFLFSSLRTAMYVTLFYGVLWTRVVLELAIGKPESR